MTTNTDERQRTDVIPAGFADLLGSTALAHISTIGPGGEPQNSPVWFHWDGTSVRFGAVEGRQKLRNLRRDARVAVTIVDPANPYRYIEIRGRAERFDADPDRAFVRVVARKYTGDESFQGSPGDYVTVSVTPERVIAFGQ